MLMMLPELIFTLLDIIVIVIAEDLPSQSNMVEPTPTSKGISVAQDLPRRPPKYGEKRTPHRLHPVIDISSVENDFSVWIRLTEFFNEETAWGVEYTLSPPESTISIPKIVECSAHQSHRRGLGLVSKKKSAFASGSQKDIQVVPVLPNPITSTLIGFDRILFPIDVVRQFCAAFINVTRFEDEGALA
ncbi:MAG: hypothetical protein Q9198_000339 [Flavoplaca austrocitrina]